MNRLFYIRRYVFRITQAEMAGIAGVRQNQISRWEHGLRRPSLVELERIRAAAAARNLPWDDSWFFELPEEVAA